MRRIMLAALAAVITLPVGFARADLIWTGGGDAMSIYQEANWQDSDTGLAPATGTIDKNVDINNALIVRGGAVGGSSGGGAHLQLGEGGSLTMSDGTFRMTVGAGIRTINPLVGGTGVKAPIDLTGGDLLAQFVLDIQMSLSGESSLTLYGGGNPVNSSTIDISGTDVTLHFLAETPDQFVTEHLSKITIDGTAAIVDENLSVVGDGGTGSVVTVIPEPATLILFGLGGLCLRKRP